GPRRRFANSEGASRTCIAPAALAIRCRPMIAAPRFSRRRPAGKLLGKRKKSAIDAGHFLAPPSCYPWAGDELRRPNLRTSPWNATGMLQFLARMLHLESASAN